MSAHTPGPWVAQGRREVEVMGPDYRITTLEFDEGDTEGFECAQADARLIAAAPDLLAACEAALARYDDRYTGTTNVGDLLDDAIAKARGGK